MIFINTYSTNNNKYVQIRALVIIITSPQHNDPLGKPRPIRTSSDHHLYASLRATSVKGL